MRILVLGAAGQLGRELVPRLRARGHRVTAVGKAEVDITSPEAVAAVLEQKFDRAVNCAAYTKVDLAESEPERAWEVNAKGAAVVAEGCAAVGVPLCHISTDFVFSQAPAAAGRPWRETDVPDPQGVYAKSKRAGEVACQAAGGDLFLVRTAWLYGNSGPNFPLAIVRAAAAGGDLRVVSDQWGSPTWTGDLVVALERLLGTTAWGVYHLTGSGVTSWFEFARALLHEVGLEAKVTPVSTAEWGAAAPRPRYSVLDNGAWQALGEGPLPEWGSALCRYVRSERHRALAVALGSPVD